MKIDREIAWFKANRAELVEKYEGKWIVVHDAKLVGVYDESSEAYNAGVTKTRCGEILVRQVTAVDIPLSIPAYAAGVLHATLSY